MTWLYVVSVVWVIVNLLAAAVVVVDRSVKQPPINLLTLVGVPSTLVASYLIRKNVLNLKWVSILRFICLGDWTLKPQYKAGDIISKPYGKATVYIRIVTVNRFTAQYEVVRWIDSVTPSKEESDVLGFDYFEHTSYELDVKMTEAYKKQLSATAVRSSLREDLLK